MKKVYKIIDVLIGQMTRVLSILTVMFLVLIIAMILKESLHIFKQVNFFDFIVNDKWRPLSEVPALGVRNMILGTFYVSLLALLISTPISIGVSVFVTLHTKGKVRNVILGIINLMAGIPSVVYGFFSFFTLVLFFEKKLNFPSGESFFIAGVTLAVMVLPLMVSAMTYTMEKVRDKYKISAKALGTSSSYIAIKLIIPASLQGIITAVSIALSRSLGETMAVLMVLGNSNLKPTLFGKGITLSGLITLEMGSAVINSDHYHGIYAAGFILMIILIFINIAFGVIKKAVDENV